jgi:DTW domain-containing protein YfiP
MSRAICPRCQRPSAVCFCQQLQAVDNHWPIHILQHPWEARHPIGTAIIAQLSLSHCQRLSSDSEDSEEKIQQLCQQQALLVYPGSDSQPVSDFIGHAPRPLIVIDGTWRKAKRILLESPLLQSLPKISFKAEQASRYQIRKSPNPNALSTLEAIVQVLSTLEESSEKYQPLLTTMEWTIQQQINKMGRETFERNYSKSGGEHS